MTGLQLAREHCANWLGNGKGCLGAMIDDDLQIRRCIPKPKCVLGTPGQRCLYFEECLAPMARSMADPRRREEFAQVVRQYRLAAKLPCTDERPCPRCGRAMTPRQRFCRVCAAARNRANQRTWIEKRRGELSKVKAFSAVEQQGVARGVLSDRYGDSGQPQNGG